MKNNIQIKPFLFALSQAIFWTIFTCPLIAQDKIFPGADEQTPSLAHYFTWINNTAGGAPEDQTMINLDFFKWLNDEYGMQLDIYAFDAAILDGGGEYVTLNSERFKNNYPNSFGPVSKKAAEMGIRLGVWLGPDGFGDTPEEEKERTDMLVSLCRDFNFRLFKMDLMLTQLRPEKQDAFIRAMQACRKYTPDLIVLNHRVDFGKAAPYVTTNLWNGDETYIDVHMTNRQTATHNRVAAISRGLIPGLERMLEDHGVCLSSCLDYWEDDLVMQAFNRSLLLAPELYGNPWFLRDDEYPRLARLFNIHRQNRDILITGMVLPEDQYGENAVSRGDDNRRLITLSNISWEPVSYKIRLDESIGLKDTGPVNVIQYHPFEEFEGRFNYGEEVSIKVYPFRSALIMATNNLPDEPLINGCGYEVIQNVPDRDMRIKLMGYPGTKHKITLINNHKGFESADLEGEDVSELLDGKELDIRFKGEPLKADWHRKFGDLQPVPIPGDAEVLYEESCFTADNNALEVRAIQRSGPTSIPQVQKSRDAFFNQSVFTEKGVWDKFCFDGDLNTSFNILHRQRDSIEGALRIDLGSRIFIDRLVITLPDSNAVTSFVNNKKLIAEVSEDLKTWTQVSITCSGSDLNLNTDHDFTVRYFRLSKAPEKILEIEGIHQEVKTDRSSWRASNLFTLYSENPAIKTWGYTFVLDEAARGSYLAVPIAGKHGKEGAFAALRIGDRTIGATSRSPSYIANVWEYRVQTRDSNYTYYFPLTDEMTGKTVELVVLGLNAEFNDLHPEVWITSYPTPFEEKELTLKW
jgi:hypothetical protein